MKDLLDKEQKTKMLSGHRGRVREILYKRPLFELPDRLVLEFLLFGVYPRIDTADLSRAILLKFGTLEKVLSASKEELLEVKGIGEVAANMLCTYSKAMDLISTKSTDTNVFNTLGKVVEFFSNKIFSDNNICVVYLDAARSYIGEKNYKIQDLQDLATDLICGTLEHNAVAILMFYYQSKMDLDSNVNKILKQLQKIYFYIRVLDIYVFDLVIANDKYLRSFQNEKIIDKLEYKCRKKIEEQQTVKLKDSGKFIYDDDDICTNGVLEYPIKT